MSLQDSVEPPRKQETSTENLQQISKTASKTQQKAHRKRKLSSHKHDNVIRLNERVRIPMTESQRKNQMKSKMNTATQTSPEAQQGPATTSITIEALQMLIAAAAGQNQQQGPQKQARRSPFSTRRTRDVIMLSFQCDRELAEELDKIAAELHMRGEATTKKATYERVFKEGMKAIRQAK